MDNNDLALDLEAQRQAAQKYNPVKDVHGYLAECQKIKNRLIDERHQQRADRRIAREKLLVDTVVAVRQCVTVNDLRKAIDLAFTELEAL